MENKEVALDIRCSYMRAGTADYYARNKNVSQIDAPIDAFEKTASDATDLLSLQVGLIVNLSKGEN